MAEQCPSVPLPKPLIEMTCGEFIACLEEDYPMRFFRERRALRAFGMYRQFLSEMKAISDFIQRQKVEQTQDEQAATQGVEFPTFAERILLDNIRHYHLHSTEEAERLPLADWLLTLKADSAESKYQRNLSRIQAKRHGEKRH